jgi:heptosyltransferase-2
MNINSIHKIEIEDPSDTRPILIIPYMWIGDFVRGHTVVRVLKARWPNRPVDLLVTPLCAPLVDYMPGVRATRLSATRTTGPSALLSSRPPRIAAARSTASPC